MRSTREWGTALTGYDAKAVRRRGEYRRRKLPAAHTGCAGQRRSRVAGPQCHVLGDMSEVGESCGLGQGDGSGGAPAHGDVDVLPGSTEHAEQLKAFGERGGSVADVDAQVAEDGVKDGSDGWCEVDLAEGDEGGHGGCPDARGRFLEGGRVEEGDGVEHV